MDVNEVSNTRDDRPATPAPDVDTLRDTFTAALAAVTDGGPDTNPAPDAEANPGTGPQPKVLLAKDGSDKPLDPAVQDAQYEGYTTADANTALASGDKITSAQYVSQDSITFSTANGHQIVVDKNTNSALYNQAFDVEFNANFDATRKAVAGGYTQADANTALQSGDSISNATMISGESIQFTTANGQNVVVDKNTNSDLYNQAFNTAFNAKFDAAVKDGYTVADGGFKLGDGETIDASQPPQQFSDSILQFTTSDGRKVMVSKDGNSDLYNQAQSGLFNANYNSNFNASYREQSQSLVTQAQSQGYTLADAHTQVAPGSIDTNTPPQSLGNGLIQFQTTSGQKYVVDQTTNGTLYRQVSDPGADSLNAYIDQSPEAQKSAGDWGAIAGNGSDTPTQAQLDLNRPGTAAQVLADNWQQWGLHGEVHINFNDPTSSPDFANMPPEAQATLKYIAQTPSLISAMDAGGTKGTNDGIITQKDVQSFASGAQDDAKQAAKAYSDYLKNNPGAGDVAKSMAQSAAIVMGNNTLAAGAGLQQGQSTKGDVFANNLSALANDKGVSPELSSAAAMWGQPGMMRMLDIGGDDPSGYKADGDVQRKNIGDWLTKQGPATDGDALAMLNGAATRNATADVDTSKLSGDVLANPQNYDGKTKAAVLTQLSDARTRLAASDYKDNNTGLYDKYTAPHHGLNPNELKVSAQLDNSIETLANDPDVQSFLQQSRGQQLQNIVGSNPSLKSAVQNYANGPLTDGSALTNALNQKDKDGNPVPTGAALQNFTNQAVTADLALGGDGNPDLHAVAEKSGQMDAISTYYKSQLVSGQSLADAIGKGTDPIAASQDFMANAAAAQALLGPNASPDDANLLQQNYATAMSDGLLNSADSDVLNNTIGDGKGNFDEAKVTEAINQAAQNDPSLLTASDGSKIDPAKVVGLLRNMWDMNRQGEKMTETLPKAMAKLGMDDPGLGQVSESYKQGLLHIGSAVLAGGVLVARSATGSNTPTADAGRVSAGLQFAGLMMEGSAKYAKSSPMLITPYNLGADGKPMFPVSSNWRGWTTSQIDTFGNLGKVVGASGSMIGGALGMMSGIQEIRSGDKLAGGLDLTAGILGSGAALASLIEGGAGLAGYGSSTLGVMAGAAAGILGEGAAIFGGIASAALPVVLADKRGKEQDAFYGNLVPVLRQYGLTGGPTMDGDYPEDPIPAINT